MPLLRYLLDTHVMSNFFRHQPGVTAHFRDAVPGSLAISTNPVAPLLRTEAGKSQCPREAHLSKALKNLSSKWIPASNLEVGDMVLTSSGHTLRLRASSIAVLPASRYTVSPLCTRTAAAYGLLGHPVLAASQGKAPVRAAGEFHPP